MSDPLQIISLGAGVQSSTMALMAAAGEITPMPDAAIFADTQAEPRSVYDWLDWLEKQLPFPVYRVTQGSLEEDTQKLRTAKDGHRYVRTSIPAYTSSQSKDKGILRRKCTRDFKLAPLKRQARKLMLAAGTRRLVQWVGISLDEAHRMKPAQEKYIEVRWPLIERRVSRQACLVWMENHGHPKPPRSACVFCPYHNDREWLRLKTEEPAEFIRAVAFEAALQRAVEQCEVTESTPYLHASRTPLHKIDFETLQLKPQIELFGNECEGMCGV